MGNPFGHNLVVAVSLIEESCGMLCPAASASAASLYLACLFLYRNHSVIATMNSGSPNIIMTEISTIIPPISFDMLSPKKLNWYLNGYRSGHKHPHR